MRIIQQWHDWRMRNILLRLLRGEVLPEQRQRLENHLAHCAGCRQRLQGWTIAEQHLTQQKPSAMRLAPRKAQRLFAAARMQAEVQTQHRLQTVRRRSIGALTGACTLLVVWAAHPRTEVHEPKIIFAANTTNQPLRHKNGQITTAGSTARPLPDKTMVTAKAQPAETFHRYLPNLPGLKRNVRRHSVVTTKSASSRARRRYHLISSRRWEALLTSRHVRANHLVSRVKPLKVVVNKAIALANGDDRRNRRNGASLIPQEDLRLMAQNRRELPPNGHLFITVTNASEGLSANLTMGNETTGYPTTGTEIMRSATLLPPPLERNALEADSSGTATVSALQVDEEGAQIWRVSSVAQNRETLTTMLCAKTWQNGRKRVSSLTVTTETVQGDTK